MNRTQLSLLGFVGLGLGIVATGCGTSSSGASGGGNGPEGPTGTLTQPLEALTPLHDCTEVETYIRETLKADIDKQVDAQIKSINESPQYYGGCYYGGHADAGAASGAPVPTAPSGSGAVDDANTKGASQTSGTNNQVAGVDEADFVKNDNTYIYTVTGGALRIVKAWPANEAHAIAKVPLEGEPRKLFVDGDRALVYVAVPPPGIASGSSGGYGQSECTYGYDCVPTGDGTSTKVLVFDISNRAAPTKIREIGLSGSLLAARRIGNAVHTVLHDASVTIEGLRSYPNVNCDSNASDEDRRATMIAAWEKLRTDNKALIDKADVHRMLPSVREGGASLVQGCAGYYRPSLAEGGTFTSVVSLDITGGPVTTATVVSDPGVVYASETGLYMSIPHTHQDSQPWYGAMDAEKQASTIHAFRIGEAPSLTGYVASGVVKGRVLNQFSLDEWDGHLRVATTSGHTPDPEVHSTLTVLARDGQKLVETGRVDHIAPTEDIRSVRFDGSRGFVVTFKKTDPLFVLDLGSATAPSLVGELQIPGFSTYMHMMDAQHLLAIGYDADDQGSFAWFQGILLQIFDVSDMKNPKLAFKEVIGTRGSSSEALTDHLAFTYFAPKKVLALPMTICEGGSGGTYGTNMTFSGLMVYDATTDAGFHLRGRVAHPQTQDGGYNSSACSNWWTEARSEVKRSIFMDDFVYSISDRRLKVNALANLGVDVAEIPLDD